MASKGARFGSQVLDTSGDPDIFAGQLDQKGSFRWLTSAKSDEFEILQDLQVDAKGNTYIIGHFAGMAQFGAIRKSTPGGLFYVAQIDPKGVFRWVLTGPFQKISVTNDGRVYVAGVYVGGEERVGSVSLPPSPQGTTAYVAQLDVQRGELAWAKVVARSKERPCGLLFSAGSALHMALCAEAEFEINNQKSGGKPAGKYVFIQLNRNGEIDWHQTIGATLPMILMDLHSTADGVWLLGGFEGELRVGSTSLQRSSTQTQAAFVARMDTSGKLLALKQYDRDKNHTKGQKILVDQHGNAYISVQSSTGVFSFEPTTLQGSPVHTHLMKTDGQGKELWSTDPINAHSIAGLALAPDGTLAILGAFAEAIRIGSLEIQGFGSSDIFLARLDTKTGEWRCGPP